MIIKERTVPEEIIVLQALLDRILDTHKAKESVCREFDRRLAGYKGEMFLNYPLSFLPSDDFLILHNLRLFDGTHYFQVDTLIINTKFIVLVEAKNMAGTLYFDPGFNQLIRRNEKGEEAFSDPLLQIKRHRIKMKKWLARMELSHLPIETLIVISNPRTILQSSSDSVHKKVIHTGQLPFHIEALNEKYKREHLGANEALELAQSLVKNNYPRKTNVKEKYGVQPADLIKGVKCPDCGCIPCKREHGKWVCKHCGMESKDAHVSALRDYALLIDSKITNRAARDFLIVNSRAAIHRMLTSLNLPAQGTRRWRVYSLDTLLEGEQTVIVDRKGKLVDRRAKIVDRNL
ncbi:nuclease-related domain-containing protein [Rossellomorea vietnamensis]|uniref:nuclease-related domain-containing protein n=1 Tax=Rossellomorea vietnamensis TaxID=218284 RepID=UPI003CF670C0